MDSSNEFESSSDVVINFDRVVVELCLVCCTVVLCCVCCVPIMCCVVLWSCVVLCASFEMRLLFVIEVLSLKYYGKCGNASVTEI